MARTTKKLTPSYQEIAKGQAVITVKSGSGTISLNDAANSTNAISYSVNPGDQFEQTSVISTYASGDGITLVIDEA